MSGVTEPEKIYELRSKLDSQCFYDNLEVDTVVNVALRGDKAKSSDLDAALTPVAERLLKMFSAAKQLAANSDGPAAKDAADEMKVLWQFKKDISAYVRVLRFLVPDL